VTAFALYHEGQRQSRHVRQLWFAGYAIVVGFGLVIAAVARHRVTEPFLGMSLALILLLLTGWLLQPRVTLYATLALTAISDIVTVSWFPFVKNLSSRESISFVDDSLTVSPLELSLLLGLVISVVRHYAKTRRLFQMTAMTWPIIAFTSFVVYGFARGIVRGSDLRIAVLEGRALFYILAVFVIVVNECTELRHLRTAFWAVLVGVVIQAILSVQFLGTIDPITRDSLESLNEHGSAVAQNLLIVALLALLLLGVTARWQKLAILAGLVPTMYVYFVSQRRAGIAALLIAGAFLAVALFWRRRRLFWIVTPMIALLMVGYVGAFWNSQSSVAFPAQAIKAVIAPGSASYEDQSSDLYRLVEAYDLNFTIRADPIKGLGFGQPFYRPVTLPDISWFELSAYVPHNSVLWIWIKMGFLGFVSMFYLFSKAILLGADRVRRTASGVDLVVALCAVSFVGMYAVYSYVDISWDARNTVFLGLACAICTAKDAKDDPRDRGADGEPIDASRSPRGVRTV
jgi:hypothetical protein